MLGKIMKKKPPPKPIELPVSYPDYTERRAADRLKMARAVSDLVRVVAPMRVGVDIVMDRPNDQSLTARVKGPGGLSVRVEFDGTTPPQHTDIYVLSWHMDGGPSSYLNRIDPRFAPKDSINQAHHRKATDVCYGFPALMERLKERLECMERGEAVVYPTAEELKPKLQQWVSICLNEMRGNEEREPPRPRLTRARLATSLRAHE